METHAPPPLLPEFGSLAERRRLMLKVCDRLMDAPEPPLRLARLDLADAGDDQEFCRRLVAALLLHDGRAGCPVTVRGRVYELAWRADPGAGYLTLTSDNRPAAFDLGRGEFPPTFPQLARRIANYWMAGPGLDVLREADPLLPRRWPDCPVRWDAWIGE